MAENYIRPPIVAREAPSQRAAIWRFRAYLALAVVAFIIGVVLIFIAITGSKNDNPGIGGTLAPTHVHSAGHHSVSST